MIDRRMRLAMMSVAAVSAVALAFGAYQYQARSQSQYALKVNGTTFSDGAIATRVAEAVNLNSASTASGTSKGAAVAPTRGQVISQIITEELEDQEAHKRGLTCSSAEAVGQQATAIAQSESAGQGDALLAAAAEFGIISPSYLSTPAAERTPNDAGVVSAYLNSPAVAAETTRGCEIGKLFEQLRQQAGGGLNGEKAISDVRSQLHAKASVSGPAAAEANAAAAPTTTAVP